MTTDQQTTLTSLLQRIQTALKAATTAIEDGDDPANLPGDVSEAFYHFIEEIDDVDFDLICESAGLNSLLAENAALRQQLARLNESLTEQLHRAEGAEHVVTEAAIRPGLDYRCRCDYCRASAESRAEAGYMGEVPPQDRWWEQTPESSDTDRNAAPERLRP